MEGSRINPWSDSRYDSLKTQIYIYLVCVCVCVSLELAQGNLNIVSRLHYSDAQEDRFKMYFTE